MNKIIHKHNNLTIYYNGGRICKTDRLEIINQQWTLKYKNRIKLLVSNARDIKSLFNYYINQGYDLDN